MTKLSQDTWVLIADGEKALFLQNHTDGKDPYLQVVRKEEQENPPTREQAANRPGRMSDGPSGHRSAFDDTDWHELEKERFAKDLADILYKLAHKGRFWWRHPPCWVISAMIFTKRCGTRSWAKSPRP